MMYLHLSPWIHPRDEMPPLFHATLETWEVSLRDHGIIYLGYYSPLPHLEFSNYIHTSKEDTSLQHLSNFLKLMAKTFPRGLHQLFCLNILKSQSSSLLPCTRELLYNFSTNLAELHHPHTKEDFT